VKQVTAQEDVKRELVEQAHVVAVEERLALAHGRQRARVAEELNDRHLDDIYLNLSNLKLPPAQNLKILEGYIFNEVKSLVYLVIHKKHESMHL
jgi:hypothetical protein